MDDIKAKMIAECEEFSALHDMRFEWIDWRFGLSAVACGELVTFEIDLSPCVAARNGAALQEAVRIWLAGAAEGIKRARLTDDVLSMASLAKLLQNARDQAGTYVRFATDGPAYAELLPHLDRCIELEQKLSAAAHARAADEWDDDDDDGGNNVTP